MPTYIYECAKCGEELEVWQSIKDDSLTKHPKCGGKLTKVFQPAGIVLKGSGFYRTDNRSSSSGASPGSKDSGSDSGAGNGSGSKDSGSKDSGSKSSGSKDAGSKSTSSP